MTSLKPRSATRRLAGLGVSPGIAAGRAHVLRRGRIEAPRYQLPNDGVEAEAARLAQACGRARTELEDIRDRLTARAGPAVEDLAQIIDVQIAMVSGSRLMRAAETRIRDGRQNAESALEDTLEEFARAYADMDDAYLASRISDIRAAAERVLALLCAHAGGDLSELPPGTILIAREITPADTAMMDPARIAGFAAEMGGAQGHTAIMARALGIPAVLGIDSLLDEVRTGDEVVIDGTGMVVIDPDPATRASVERRRAEARDRDRRLRDLASEPAVTADGVAIGLTANIELPGEVAAARANGAAGIGLVRSEFVFLNRDTMPDEEEQAELLGDIVRRMDGHPVTIRTLDVGGEKALPALADYLGHCPNPALGLRAVRLSLRAPDLLRMQLAAILRAAVHGPVRILLPMITTGREMRQVRAILVDVAAGLRQRGIAVPDPLPPLGAMIEVPAAALAADSLAQDADFFSIGTNDLTMYALAIDRANEQVADLYDPLNPAVLRLIQFTTAAARRAGIPVNICGEIAGDPWFTPLLIGFGLTDLSMTAQSLLAVKQRIRSLSAAEARVAAGQAMAETDPARIAAVLDRLSAAG
ncbi:MAG: phosphoenolpyruvate--protein phosphotransferase [Alphaproteobacteria bacterium]|nr:phosphoenolpyruvate--protein phosphotransferase [Alphaproteobacteria bacterium]MDX5370008.1 phosphoenolpyruvate--protein phosphotransferase [Alphaproteobacteria bacterium]MDX5464586.1 phosphoenolpyruvate--protein phosphotransferase [Alphaproteobacteria bacterium]